MPGLCRGLAHELGNTLTFLLPLAHELGEVSRALDGAAEIAVGVAGSGSAGASVGGTGPIGDSGAAPGAGPTDDGNSADLQRIGWQLRQGSERLSRLHRDLRLAYAEDIAPGRLIVVELRASAREVLGSGEGEAVWVHAEPVALSESLRRLGRAAAGWAEVRGLAPPLLRVVRGAGVGRVEAVLVGPADRLPAPDTLLEVLCPAESGAVRAERGPLGIFVGRRLLQAQGGRLLAEAGPAGVVLAAELPLAAAPDPGEGLCAL